MNRRTVLKFSGLVAANVLLGGCGQSDSDVAHAADQEKSKVIATTQSSTVQVKVFNAKGELVGPISEPKVVKTDAEWKKQLTADQYKIARAKGTERPFCGNLLDNHKDGVYVCVCCNLPLFASNSKFNSGSGWPSFFQPISKENVVEQEDDSYGQRTEILCARCDCHLGHVFDDGPKPTGLRFCVNSESLTFTAQSDLAKLADPAAANVKS